MALVLSRREHEAIIIGDNIEVMIGYIKGDKVGLSVDAPPDVSIHRKEIYDDMQREGRLRPLAKSYLDGVIDGLTRWAWWRGGVQYVGNGSTTLAAAIAAVKKEHGAA